MRRDRFPPPARVSHLFFDAVPLTNLSHLGTCPANRRLGPGSETRQAAWRRSGLGAMTSKQEGWPFGRGRDGGEQPHRASVRIAALAVCIPLFGGWAKGSGVEIVSRYYSIHGADHAELVASVRRNGPKGGRAYGIGYIDFFPRYRSEASAGGCRIAEAEVGLRVELELPRWDGARDGPQRIANFARRFARAIEAHEMEHVRIARHYARRMRSELLRLKADSSCWSLSSRAEDLIRDLKKRHIESQKAFDRRVNKQIKRLL